MSIIFTFIYKNFARNYGPLSIPNNRSLHNSPIPVGGGLAILISSLIGIIITFNIELLSKEQFYIFGIGSLLTGLVGVLDERINIRPIYQLATQFISAFYTFIAFDLYTKISDQISINILVIVVVFIILFLIIWLYNAFNFVDGCDGMASSCIVFITLPMIIIFESEGYQDLVLLLTIILASNIGFLFFNKPKAKIFMGDSGTKYLSFFLVAIILESLQREPRLIFVWITLASFYLVDTTLTTFTRFLTVPRFWEGHRTHAYQNLVQLWGSHKKVLKFTLLVNLFWCMPLGFLSYSNINYSQYICIISLIPLTIYSYKYGPRFHI
ncbi:hypothetical protein [uncultured Prochlorococcus sp.]|uniref:hypothetical protein n=1 Tax=uncultured Prochlorococcus sp. TaxID=159733 RepID=UPI00258A720B|nr:hypothetical protein [uncultured Prochlorococcus sp.]